MKKLDEVMISHMKYIVIQEKRPFSYLDFRSFEVQGHVYNMRHGTFRNKISELARNEVAVLDIIQDVPAQKNALHDIHFRFEVPDIWKVLYHSGKYTPNSVSKDIAVNILNANEIKLTTIVHKTDTVTVSAACSNMPVAADTRGLIRLSNALTRAEERLSRIVDECGSLIPDGYESIPVPTNDRWLVTMCHFGYDSLIEYAGPRFCVTWKDGQDALARAYSKRTETGLTLRTELQQYPQKSLGDIVTREAVFRIPWQHHNIDQVQQQRVEGGE